MSDKDLELATELDNQLNQQRQTPSARSYQREPRELSVGGATQVKHRIRVRQRTPRQPAARQGTIKNFIVVCQYVID